MFGALMSLMFFRDYMERNGRYQVDEDRAAEQEARAQARVGGTGAIRRPRLSTGDSSLE